MKLKKIKIETYLFYLSYFLFLMYAFFGTIDILKAQLKLLTNISLIFILMNFLIQIKKYKNKELARIILLVVISIAFVVLSDNYLLLKFILINILVKDINFEKRISFDIKIRILFLFVMIILFDLGIAQDNIALFNGKIRHSLGFSNPNVLGYHVLILCMELLLLNADKLSFIKVITFTGIMMISYLYSGSRTAFYLHFVLILLFIIYKYKRKLYYNSIVKKIIIYSPLWTSIIVYILYILYCNNTIIGNLFNKILSGRLSNIAFFSGKYSMNLFGNNIALANKSCDTAIVYMLYAMGYIGAFLYIWGFQKLLKKLYYLKKINLIIIIFVFVIYGISEKLWLFTDCNILLTIFGYIIYENKKGEKNE